jgi:hypothetical protein
MTGLLIFLRLRAVRSSLHEIKSNCAAVGSSRLELEVNACQPRAIREPSQIH